MASEPGIISFESFEGGLAQSPYTGTPNQYAYANKLDHWTEPGTLVGNVDFEKFSYGPNAAGSSLYAPPYAIIQEGGASSTDTYWGLFKGLNDKAIITQFSSNGSINGQSAFKSLATLGDMSTTAPETFSSPMIDYLGSLLVGLGNDNLVVQSPSGISNASLFTRTLDTNAVVTDLLVFFGYAYIAAFQTSLSSPGYIERYDYSNGSFINAASAILSPAVELEQGWNPVSMDTFGEFIAIAALPIKTARHDSGYSIASSSRLYLWDGISTTFESKVDIPGFPVTAIKTHNGQLYLFASSRGGIDILRFAGGTVTQRVGRISVGDGSVRGSNELSIPYVRNEAISAFGDKIYVGVTVPSVTRPRGYTYSFDVRTGATDLIFKPSTSDNIFSTTALLFTPSATSIGYLTDSTLSSAGRYTWHQGDYSSASDTPETGNFDVVTTTAFAPIGKKIKVRRALVRHSYMPSNSSLAVYLNRNIEMVPRTSNASLTQRLIMVGGADANTPGVGDNALYEHAYSFSETDGPIPLLDSISLSMNVSTNASGSNRPRVFLPVIVEVDYVDSPN